MTAIYDQLVVEHWWDPLDVWAWPSASWSSMPTPCPICGSYDPVRMDVADHSPYQHVCADCWQFNRHLRPELWHCAKCGVYLAPMQRCVVASLRLGPTYLCPNHFQQRTGARP